MRTPVDPSDPAPRSSASLGRQVARARIWLPALIVGVVLVIELAIAPSLGDPAGDRFRLLFYALAGPAATAATLSWIVREVRARESAQAQLADTYDELAASHRTLAGIQRVTERFAAASDLESAVRAMVHGLQDATAASGAAVVLGDDADAPAFSAAWDEAAQRATQTLTLTGGPVLRRVPRAADDDRPAWMLSAPVTGPGGSEGAVHALYSEEPDASAREAFGILAAEFASTAEAASARMRDLLTLFDVDRSIRAEGNMERLLDTILRRILERLGATRGAVFLADDRRVLRPVAVRPDTDRVTPLRVPDDRLGRWAAEGRPRIERTLDEEVRSEAGGLLREAGALVLLPLQDEAGLLGAVALAHPDPGRVPDAQLPFLTLLAGQASFAVRNARAYLHSEELAIGQERSRIAREIHDGVAQSLAFAALQIDLGRRLVDDDPLKADASLRQAAEAVRESIREVRRSIFALRPVTLERYGFRDTVRRYLADFGPQNDLHVDLELGDTGDLEVRSEAVLFRIFQEAMHNVAKHAAARTVQVTVGRTPAGLAFVEVRDDGRGFEPEEVGARVTSAGGLGLAQMRERVEGRGGRFTLHSAPGTGTTVRAEVP